MYPATILLINLKVRNIVKVAVINRKKRLKGRSKELRPFKRFFNEIRILVVSKVMNSKGSGGIETGSLVLLFLMNQSQTGSSKEPLAIGCPNLISCFVLLRRSFGSGHSSGPPRQEFPISPWALFRFVLRGTWALG